MGYTVGTAINAPEEGGANHVCLRANEYGHLEATLARERGGSGIGQEWFDRVRRAGDTFVRSDGANRR